MTVLETDRLVLRHWHATDRLPFAEMNADPRVMEFMPATLSRPEIDTHGFGLFAAELRRDRSFIGFIGLSIPSFQASFTPCVEVGWRLSPIHWGKGLATEGAREVIRHAFEGLGLEAVVSFTVPANARSRRVMEKLGMTHDPADDFDHPNLPQGHPLRRHVLYRLRASRGMANKISE